MRGGLGFAWFLGVLCFYGFMHDVAFLGQLYGLCVFMAWVYAHGSETTCLL